VKYCTLYQGYSRYFGYPARIKVTTSTKLSTLVDEHNGIHPCHLSISHYKENKPYLSYIPFDFDGHINRVLSDTNKLEALLSKHDIPYQIKFSGQKGTHCVIPLTFNPEQPQFVSPQTLSDIQMHCVTECKLETFDYHLRGNINALLRIPYTLHETTKKPCVVLRDTDETISIDEVCQRLNVKEFTYKFSNNFVSNEAIHPYPCLEYFIQVPNPLNYCRVAFVIYRLHQGRTVQEIYDELSKLDWIDFKKNKTRYHLKKVADRGYSMPSCDKIKSYGLCFGCKYDDSQVMKRISKRIM